MGGGRGRTYGGRGALKGKGVGTAGKAVAKDATLHVDLLRAFPAEDGPILLHRNGAQVLEPTFLTQLLPLRIRSYSIGLLKASVCWPAASSTARLQFSGRTKPSCERTALPFSTCSKSCWLSASMTADRSLLLQFFFLMRGNLQVAQGVL